MYSVRTGDGGYNLHRVPLVVVVGTSDCPPDSLPYPASLALLPLESLTSPRCLPSPFGCFNQLWCTWDSDNHKDWWRLGMKEGVGFVLNSVSILQKKLQVHFLKISGFRSIQIPRRWADGRKIDFFQALPFQEGKGIRLLHPPKCIPSDSSTSQGFLCIKYT